ncbi:MAG: serine/threonine protein kinase [Rhodobacterales bacterium]|nr:MAG: serine/threonine protein kinase [Rhodobacterales bacterium]
MSFLPYGRRSSSGWLGAYGMSLALHGGVLVAFLALRGMTWTPPDPPAPEVNFTVTLERLDADTLAGIMLREGKAGAEGTDPAADLPEDPEQPEESLTPPESEPEPEVDTAPDPTAEVAPDPEPELAPDPDPAPEPETVSEPEPTELAAIEPEAVTPEPLASEPALNAIQPEAVEAAPVVTAGSDPSPVPTAVAPDSPALSPILPETVATAPVVPAGSDPAPVPTAVTPDSPALSPVLSDTVATAPVVTAGNDPGLVSTAVAPVDVGVATVAPVDGADGPPVITARTRPTPPAPVRAPRPPSAQDLAIGDLIKRIRAQDADPCLTALPRRDGADGVGLAMVSAKDGVMEEFARALLTPEDAIRQTRTLVDPRQCPALAYMRENRDYPATRMGLRVDTPEVVSGGRLTGVLRGVAGRNVTLLLIDDNGVVQDLQRFLAFSGNLVRFDVPVTRSGPATKRAPSQLRARNGQLAQDVFAGLTGELADSAYIATATFDVR